MSLVPANLPIRVAAALAARSEPAFREHVLPHVADGSRVSTDGLGQFLGRPVEPLDYLAACRSLEPRRARERGYKNQGDPASHRGPELEGPDGRPPADAF